MHTDYLTAVSRPIAQETGRSVDTIGYALRRFDREYPDPANLPDRQHPLPAEMRARVYRQYGRGESVAALAQRFCQTPTGICRIINTMRTAQIMELPLDHIGNEQFARLRSQKKEGEILGPLPASDPPAKKPQMPKGVPAYLASLYDVPLLTREQEVHLFRKMNYLQYKASALRAELDLDRPESGSMDRIEILHEEAVATKNQIIRANLRLVVSIAKRYVGQAGDFFELVSDGNMSLIKAVEKFDFSRGNRFSTYATWAIMKNFARTISAVFRHRDRFRTSHSETFSITEDPREPVRAGVGSDPAGVARGKASRPARRAGAADCHKSFWPDSWPGTADLEGNWSRDGRNQRADPADPVQGDEQIEKGR